MILENTAIFDGFERYDEFAIKKQPLPIVSDGQLPSKNPNYMGNMDNRELAGLKVMG